VLTIFAKSCPFSMKAFAYPFDSAMDTTAMPQRKIKVGNLHQGCGPTVDNPHLRETRHNRRADCRVCYENCGSGSNQSVGLGHFATCPPLFRLAGIRLAGIRLAGIRLAGIRLAGIFCFCVGFQHCLLPHLAIAAGHSVQENPDPSADQPASEDTTTDPDQLFYQGRYEAAMRAAIEQDAKAVGYNSDEGWLLLAIRCQMMLGRYPDALETYRIAIEKFPYSIRHRWQAVEVFRFNDDAQTAKQKLLEIDSLLDRQTWRFRDLENQLQIAQYFLANNTVDAKEVLKRFLTPLKQTNPRLPSIYFMIGKLGLQKGDFKLAAENFQEAVKLEPKNPDAYFGLAQAFRSSDPAQVKLALETTLTLNPNHVDGLLMLIDQQLNAEAYPAAKVLLDRVLKINPNQPIAWAYKSALAHLENQLEDEVSAREQALKHWPGNPAVDHTIGRKLSENYRFLEGSQYQRRALIYDATYLPAKMQLAHDLLRLGQELEGWKLADEVFDADQYSVAAHNLLTLRDNLTKFTTIQSGGFVVRMDRKEAQLYGDQVLDLLAAAQSVLATKYETQLQTPIFVEIFSKQQDFAIRTFGVPGGDGYLGVCFGRVVTMNSPAAQGANLTNWRSILWHEFCHVVTLQKTENKMPRWLSEGISVYEEHQRNPAWGQSINPTFRKFLLEELTPVSRLSGAFLNAKTPMHIQFAYYESYLVVQYIVEKYGHPALLKVLDELKLGLPINAALSRHVAPIEFLDRDFENYVLQRAKEFAVDADWTSPSLVDPSLEALKQFNLDHPNSVPGLMYEAAALIQAKEFVAAQPLLLQVIQLAPEVANDAREQLALCYKNLERFADERETLLSLSQRNADSVEVFTRLLELSTAAEDWQATKTMADRLIGLNPLIPTAHRYLALAAEKTNDYQMTIRGLCALAILNPIDPADLHFRLATAYWKTGQRQQAKRNVLIALENAPRFRQAHSLFQEIIAADSIENVESNSQNGTASSLVIPPLDAPPQPKPPVTHDYDLGLHLPVILMPKISWRPVGLANLQCGSAKLTCVADNTNFQRLPSQDAGCLARAISYAEGFC